MRFNISAISLFLLLATAGCNAPSLLITPVSSSSTLEEVEVSDGNGFLSSKIAIIEVEGMLANIRSGGLLSPTENKLSLFTQQLNAAAKDDKVKAVILRINSPGGTVTCSDTMYTMIRKFRAETHKPVISSTQEVCASGAYYIACGSDLIVANPTSVVGSIGVIFETVDVSGTMMKLGIRSEPIKSAPLKDMGSPFKPLDPEARTVMQAMVDEYYARFLNVVTTNRKQLTDPAKMKTATDGRVFSGEQALAMGLVDRVGTLEDAVDQAKQMAHASDARVIMYKRPYGYSGSIYAEMPLPPPQANITTLQLPAAADVFLPRGFYYIWQD